MDTPSATTTAFIAMGSNLGDRMSLLREAITILEKAEGLKITAKASIYETSPVGGPPDQPNYFNTVIQVDTTLSPQRLLEICLKTELLLGRERSRPNAPRTMDLDLLLYGQSLTNTPTLQLPHPRLHLRRFVLQPLQELAPNLIHPTLDRTVSALLETLSDNDVVTPILPPNW